MSVSTAYGHSDDGMTIRLALPMLEDSVLPVGVTNVTSLLQLCDGVSWLITAGSGTPKQSAES